MGGFLDELGKKLAERWLSLLVLPGLLYIGALTTALTLGQTAPFDSSRVTEQVDTWTTPTGLLSKTSALVLFLVMVLLAAAAVGLATQLVGSLIERVWLAERWESWPTPFRCLAKARVRSRRTRWLKASNAYAQQADLRRSRLATQEPEDNDKSDLSVARHAITRIALERPARPTWIGDRVNAVITRMDRDYDLDLPTIWPNLWLAMPETTRNEITTSRQSLAMATALAGWGSLYLIIGLLWWPSVVIAVTISWIAWRQARIAATNYARLVEAVTRAHTAQLATSLGIDHTGPLNQQTGWALTCLLQGQTHLIPLTTGWPTAPDAPTHGCQAAPRPGSE